MKKINKMNEIAWILGVILCPLGIALCTKASFGLSMIAAPPYIIHLKMEKYFSWYTQGTSEYIWQGFLMLVMCIVVRKFKWKYLLSFATAVICGHMIDLWITILGGGAAYTYIGARISAFVLGVAATAAAVAFFFRTDLPLQMYECIVVEVADKYNLDKNKAKRANDCIMLVVAVMLAAFFNRSIKGIGVGTVIITIANSWLIKHFGAIYDRVFTFEPRFEKINSILNR